MVRFPTHLLPLCSLPRAGQTRAGEGLDRPTARFYDPGMVDTVEGEYRVIPPTEKVDGPVIRIEIPDGPEQEHRRSSRERSRPHAKRSGNARSTAAKRAAATVEGFKRAANKLAHLDDVLSRTAERLDAVREAAGPSSQTERAEDRRAKELELERELLRMKQRVRRR